MSKKKDWSKVNWSRRWVAWLVPGIEPERFRGLLEEVVPHMRHRVPEFSKRLEELAPKIEAMTFEDYMDSKKSKEGKEKHSYLGEWTALGRDIGDATRPRIPREECVHGNVYRLQSRNLVLGAWHEGKKGFSGIREKFGSRYIFMEYHWDNGAPYGTALPLVDLGPLPEGILPDDHLGSVETETGREVYWDRDAVQEGHPIGQRRYRDTNEFCEGRCHIVGNKALFEYLEPSDAEEHERLKAIENVKPPARQ